MYEIALQFLKEVEKKGRMHNSILPLSQRFFCDINQKKIPHFLLYFLNDSLESLRVVDSEVSKYLTVDLDTSLVESTHKH